RGVEDEAPDRGQGATRERYGEQLAGAGGVAHELQAGGLARAGGGDERVAAGPEPGLFGEEDREAAALELELVVDRLAVRTIERADVAAGGGVAGATATREHVAEVSAGGSVIVEALDDRVLALADDELAVGEDDAEAVCAAGEQVLGSQGAGG